MFNKTDPLIKIINKSLTGALAGLFSGLVFGLLIWTLTSLLSDGSMAEPPIQLAAFLGMGAGTAIGAVLGGVAGLKN